MSATRSDIAALITRFRDAESPIAALRHVTLVKVAGRLRWEGHDAATLGAVLHEINRTCCVPPLPSRDVERIVKNIARKPAGNGAGAASREIFDGCRAHINQLYELSLSVPWRGRSASTDLAVLHGLYSVAFLCGRVEFEASLRQVAERAGIESFRTVASAAARLRRRGWLKPLRRGSYNIIKSGNELKTKSSLWHLRRPMSVLQNRHTNEAPLASLNEQVCNIRSSPEVSFNVSSCNTVTADAWRRGGLGLTARRVWRVLATDRAVTAAGLARQLGCDRSAVTRLLNGKLKDYVVREPAGWRKSGQEPVLTFDRMQRQQREHAHDRERFADVIDSLCRRRRGARLVMSDPLPHVVTWLLVTVQNENARKLAACLIALRTLRGAMTESAA